MKTKIRLQTSRLLNERFKLDANGLEKKLLLVKKAFDKQEKKILHGLEKVTGLSFLRNYIDIFLINPDGAPSISHPTIVKINDDIDRTMYVLIHELIHTLMWDNISGDNWSLKVQTLFLKEDVKVSRHVAVHAILEAIYREVLKKPREIEKDIKECQNWPAYKRAWEIVQKEGYKNIIKKLKS